VVGVHQTNAYHSLLQAGCSKVYITSRKAKACEEAVAALNALPNKAPDAIAYSVPADISKIEEIDRLVSEINKTTDHIDILFANAGAIWGAPFETHPPEAFSKVMDLNVKSVFYTVQKMESLLKKKASIENPSRIIITASVAGIAVGTLGPSATYAYSASKAAAIHLAKNLAVELGPRGIITNAIAPGFYPTKMAADYMEKVGTQSMADSTPNRRLGKPEDIAGLVVFLCSRGSSHLNGATITTDGGAILGKTKL
jgi:NAD(P)-dependent dehydrogenase (short-subunit alcohol dehydrogenase family)